jgi:hypothetical protein
MPEPSRQAVAEGLREQAASFRRLAAIARTRAGGTALGALADDFDKQAMRVDPASLRQ